MGLIVAATTGLVIWLVLWSLGAKSIDAFLITVVITLTAVGVRMVTSHIPDRDAIDQ
ncbi:MAG: hypothetical protein JHC95_02040 [Solirubrobacteraceae bacterium]|nr:hypothetical protein [Solirubrobacteraceae bacterium]